ncbi:MAG: FtsW/RodA/SpoVE family cell cycle protein [Mycobacteriales bacterium]
MTVLPQAAFRYPRRRGLELALLSAAVLITVFGYADVGLGRSAAVPKSTLTYGLVLAAVFLAAHLVVRRLAPYADPVLLPAAAALNGLGLVMIYRLDLEARSAARAAHLPLPASDARLQMIWTAVGLLLFIGVLVLLRDHRVLQRYMYTLMAGGLALLFLPAVLPARFSAVNGAHIWILLGPLHFEPEEIAKLALEAFFAAYLVAKRELLSLAGRRFLGVDLPRARDLGPLLVAWAASVAVLGLESDVGTAFLFFGIFVGMLYVATQRQSWLIIGAGLFAIATFVAAKVFAHVRERFTIWLHPFHYATSSGYQLVQGLFGLANGGILGTGLGRGHPGIVPFASTDFIATSLGEELGLTGLMAIVVLYIVIISRGLRTALTVRDGFGKLLAVGLSFGLALQVFVQIGGVTRLIPLTGITLPFLSYGGSSLVASWMLIAMLLRISDSARRPPPPTPPPSSSMEHTQVVAL